MFYSFKPFFSIGLLCLANLSFATVIQNFDSGNINAGSSALTYMGNLGPSAGCATNSALYGEGTYAVTSQANGCHNLWAPTTAQSGSYFMAANGSSANAQSNIYTQTVAGIVAGQNYNFSGYFTGLFTSGAANLILKVYNGTSTSGTELGSFAFTTNLATPLNSSSAMHPAAWVKQSIDFTAQSGSITVQVLNSNANTHGNDFGLDTLDVTQTSTLSTTSTPEPATFLIAGFALIGLSYKRKTD